MGWDGHASGGFESLFTQVLILDQSSNVGKCAFEIRTRWTDRWKRLVTGLSTSTVVAMLLSRDLPGTIFWSFLSRKVYP